MVNSHEIPLIFNDDGNIPDMQLQNMKNMMGINGCHIVYGDEIMVYQSHYLYYQIGKSNDC